MQDDKIVELYWRRDESAIRKTEQKYGNYLKKIAFNILFDDEDSKECVNDAFLKAWDSIPPHRPEKLSLYLGRITRFIAIDMLRRKNSSKRKSSEYEFSLSELDECISNGNVLEQEIDYKIIGEAIGKYLRTLSKESRICFIHRYYYMDSIKDIAARFRMSESKVKSMLHRTRIGLKEYLTKEGYML